MAAAIPVLFGTESGNAENCADDLAKALNDAGIEARSVDMENFDSSSLASMPVAIFVSSTYGNGDPPFNARALLEHLQTPGLALPNLNFAVCGLGDSSFEHFAKCGKDFDAALRAAGAHAMLDRVDCDDDFEDTFEPFQDAVVDHLKAHPELLASSAAASEAAPVAAATSDRPTRVFDAALVASRRLSGANSGKWTMHYEFDVSGAAETYAVGDCFAVHPTNGPRAVEAVLGALRADASATVSWRDEQLPLHQVLQRACLLTVTNELLDVVTALPGSASKPAALAVAGGSDAAKAYRNENHVVDVLLQNAPDGVTAQAFVAALRKLQPRLYSVASSPAKDPKRVAFTVETLRYQKAGRTVEGVASMQLASRVEVGATVPMHFVPNAAFRFDDAQTPLIMVGPGTGIAPFRGQLEHMEARGTKRPTWLFFGHRTEADDFLYREDLQRWRDAGVLERLDCAWSRDQAEKVYVQDRMVEHGDELWAWLQRGAIVYVCGDATGMEPGVAHALRTIATEHGQADAAAWFETLVAEGRYKTDVY
ncbi:MAG: sulfite reductase flavoprotein subunit alpha [Myxococcota bacterium]